MTETYYQIVEKGKENKNGNVVKVSVNGLEIVAGEEYTGEEKLLNKFEIQNNSYKILDINENYQFFPIEEEKAKWLIKDYGDYLESFMYSTNPFTGNKMPELDDWRDM